MKKKRKHFRHLGQKDRDRIEALLGAGHTQKEIAEVLKVDKGTISREIKKRRQKNGRYVATAAQVKASVRRSNSKFQGMKVEKHPDLKEYLIAELKNHRSPDEIAGRMKEEKRKNRVGTNAIYKWLYSAFGQPYAKYLCTKRYRPRKRKEAAKKRVMIPNRIAIDKRPLGATNKTRYGHFEGDTIVAPKKTGNTESVAVVVERITKLFLGTKIPSLSPVYMQQAVQQMDSQVDMLSLTLDNGIENRSHESWPVPAFFADPHAPWQKPLVECNIGLLRRWFLPKGTDFAKIPEPELQQYFSIINHKYRKSLNYKSAYEAALLHGIIEKIP
jgi:transposase, IS30 family